jgi:hypothetical protein
MSMDALHAIHRELRAMVFWNTVELWLIAILAALLLALWSITAEASLVTRSTKARYQFQKMNPCPATGKKKGSCPGYVIDHVVALCEGGPDTPANMQWLTKAAAREKDLAMLKRCRPKGPGYHRKQ